MKIERNVWEIETSANAMVEETSSDPKLVDVVDLAFAKPKVNVAGDPITPVLGQYSYFGWSP